MIQSQYISKSKLQSYIDSGKIRTQRHSTHPLLILNYTQEAQYANSWDELTKAARGLVVEDLGTDQMRIVARPFAKFFNLSEVGMSALPDEPYTVYEKMDGCCDADTVVTTEDGPMTISDICESKYTGNVLSYNTISCEFEWKPIISHSIKRNNNDWYLIELEDGTEIKLTGNHLVWIPKIKCYRRVDELTGDEEFLLRKD